MKDSADLSQPKSLSASPTALLMAASASADFLLEAAAAVLAAASGPGSTCWHTATRRVPAQET